ncbi:MAG: ATP-binding cassette domain-containing protein, partial [Anaerolineae bacterium]|nr:ATP-binding cassette domain-containing protein [Anaerolineae bacterium]
MIKLTHVTYTYPDADETIGKHIVLENISLDIAAGEFALVVGPSGAGKSTLLRCFNGLVPHFYGGSIAGHIRVDGQDPLTLGPRQMSHIVGFVFQDPETQAVVDVVEDELAFAMESQGFSRSTMQERIDWTLNRLNIAHLRARKLSTLSGGERQRVAIAAVLTLQPRVLILDEPTSQLDPQSARSVLDTLVHLNHDLELTIVLSEHRLERVVRYADRIVYLPGDGSLRAGPPREMLQAIPLVPPLIELGRALGWSPLPLTLAEAKERIQGNKEQGMAAQHAVPLYSPKAPEYDEQKEPILCIEKASFSYNGTPVLHKVSLTAQRGEFIALMGHNGAGKS